MKKHPLKNLLIGFGIWAAGLSLAHASATSPATPEEQGFPIYAELCSVTKLKPLHDKGEGGFAGHTVLYIKGVCRDKTADFPRVKLCPADTDLNNPESGTGISVDGNFDNIVWMAVDGREDFFSGGLSPGARLDEATHRKVVREMMAKGYFKGIQFTPKVMQEKPAGMSKEEYIAKSSMGTDLALNFARNTYCARIPLKAEMLPPMVNYLNSRNAEYFNTGKHYKWDRFWDNCAHLAHNTFAAAGIVPFKKLQTTFSGNLRRLGTLFTDEPMSSSFALPGRTFAQFVELGNEGSLNVEDIYDNPLKRRLFHQYKWVADQPGSLFDFHPVRQAPENQMYDSAYVTPENLWTGGKGYTLKTVRENPRYANIEKNLEWFHWVYTQALRNHEDLRQNGDRSSRLRDPEFAKFYDDFGVYLRQQLQFVESRLSKR
jgi:hypothetical protein